MLTVSRLCVGGVSRGAAPQWLSILGRDVRHDTSDGVCRKPMTHMPGGAAMDHNKTASYAAPGARTAGPGRSRRRSGSCGPFPMRRPKLASNTAPWFALVGFVSFDFCLAILPADGVCTGLWLFSTVFESPCSAACDPVQSEPTR
eukprot:TRINITY_DN23575_c0_g1_i1.p2 TRINITY_DN23575_c0_g1~~TRINITY_DN23575_c0_g1_i1.p2  ORF type:complete len:145 (+),score=5.73 TRINITY_DN23575_c0_g1_i1:146-580(+)